MAERVAAATDPSNLMRVMPTQGGQPCNSANGFMKRFNSKTTKPGKDFWYGPFHGFLASEFILFSYE